jgi:hypothetical protein
MVLCPSELLRVLAVYPGRVHGHVHKVSFRLKSVGFSNNPYRLYLLRPSQKVMLVCRIVLAAEWILITTPNTILSFAALVSSESRFTNAYSYIQRIEPATYTCTSVMLSGLYIYHAFIMFKRHGDIKIRLLLIRLLYTNLFLIALGVGNIIAEYVGGGVVQSSYLAFLYSFVS